MFFTAALAVSSVISTSCGMTPEQAADAPEPEFTGGYDAEDVIFESTDYDTLEADYRGTNKPGMLIAQGVRVNASEVRFTKKSAGTTIKENGDLYGIGACILVNDGSFSANTGSIETDASGATALYVMESGSILLYDTEINTAAPYSGIMTARTATGMAGGALSHVKAETAGNNSGAIKVNGGGIDIDDSYIITKGKGSPVMDISGSSNVTSSHMGAQISEVLRVDSGASVWITDTELQAGPKGSNSNGFNYGILMYKSGDALPNAFERTELTISGGTYKCERGGMFYATNTEGWLYLTGVDMSESKDADFFIRASGNAGGWGEKGANGADLSVELVEQEAFGKIITDPISKLDLKIYNESSWTGTFYEDDSLSFEGSGDGTLSVAVDYGSKWIVTDSCEVDSLILNGELLDSEGKTVSVKDNEGNVLSQGDSAICVTAGKFGSTDIFSSL